MVKPQYVTPSIAHGPTYSVIVPVHNKAPHVERAISSILNQTYQDFEIIIIDDASTDNSVKEISKISDNRIRLLKRSTPGPGGYAARNLGISRAEGRWLAFLDADDEWAPNHLKDTYLLSSTFPNCSFLSCGWKKLQPDGQSIVDRYSQKNAGRGAHLITFERYMELCIDRQRPTHTCVVCLRNNDWASQIFPDGRSSRGGDLYAWISYLIQCRELAWRPTVGATYYQNAINMVTQNAPWSIQLMRDIVTDFSPHIDSREQRLINKFANRQIFEGWLWHCKRREIAFPLASNLSFRGDAKYALSRSLLSVLPQIIIRAFFTLKDHVRIRSRISALLKALKL